MFDEVPEMLKYLREKGIKTAILSNGSPDMLGKQVENAKIEPLLNAVLSADSARKYKPDPS